MPLLDTTKYKGSVGTFVADLVLQILSWIAEEERNKIRTRQAEGIANARKQGKELGRPKVTDEQAHAVTKLVENSFAGRERKTLEEIAEELGISRTTLWTWSNDVNFIRYKEVLADQLLRDNIDLANGQLLALIRGDFTNNGTPSIKALELFHKLNGKLVEKKEIMTSGDKPKISQSDVERSLAELGKGISE